MDGAESYAEVYFRQESETVAPRELGWQALISTLKISSQYLPLFSVTGSQVRH
jgi:hypothetical protein